jgi:Ca2+-transporting ATPase
MRNRTVQKPEEPWANSHEKILRYLGASQKVGLNPDEVERRLSEFGPNKLVEAKAKGALDIFIDQLKSLIVLLLVGAAGVSFLFHEIVEGIAIIVVIVINTAIGFFTELRAVRSMEALRKLGSVSTKVRRGDRVVEIPSEDLVPGDIVILEGGDVVTADLRLVHASKLESDESALTGESLPVTKGIDPVSPDAPLAERTPMLYKGTAVTRGAAEGVVVGTGMETELGRITALTMEAKKEATPLEERLDRLGHRLIWVTLVIAVVVMLSGIISGKELFLMIETGIALAVAAIPEGLPIVATIALARGMWRMAQRNALINRLSAVETLGAADYICTDKTGTLTENLMTVVRIVSADLDVDVLDDGFVVHGTSPGQKGDDAVLKNTILREIIETGVLCNNASIEKHPDGGDQKGIGDPLEIALLVAGATAGIGRQELVTKLPEVFEDAFDSDTKMMATYHRENGRYRVAVKGAPEPIIFAASVVRTGKKESPMTEDLQEYWLNRTEEMASEGLRVLALATKGVDEIDDEPYQSLHFLGLMGLLDPPREDVKDAIATCRNAGINVVMVTGDQPVTALNIAQAVGLVDDHNAFFLHGKDLTNLKEVSEEQLCELIQIPVFARVTPGQKLDLVSLYQRNGSIVAMTGDGVNDAPALKKADIGIAMGQRGTQVAREAADMVLKDDSFSTIVAAVEQGRVIYNNIKKFVKFLISCNVSEVMIVFLATLINAPLPILPLQILFLNLVTDVFPALALGVGEGDPGVMKHPPRNPTEPILTKSDWWGIAGYGVVITLSVLGALGLALLWLGMDQKSAVTVSFLTLAFIQLWHVFNMRDPGSRFFKNEVTRNPLIWGAILLCSGLLVAAVYLPGLSLVLKVADPGVRGWLVVIGMSLIPWVVGQVVLSIKRT